MIDLGYPARGKAYIRRVETVETYAASPIIITPKTRDAISKQQFIVTAVGDYERCENVEECERHHTKLGEHRHHLYEGDWVLCRNRTWDATPDPDIYVVSQSDVMGKFSEEGGR